MTDQNFHTLLGNLNRKVKVPFYCRPLTNDIDIANGWIKNRDGKSKNFSYIGPNRYYLLKEPVTGCYIGIVADAGEFDLHWYILPKFRANGYLSKALKTVILPHVFQDNRVHQHISINPKLLSSKNYIASKGLALSAGFVFYREENGKEYYTLNCSKYNHLDYFDGELSPFTDVEAENFRVQMKHHFSQLLIIESGLEMKLGETEEILDLKASIEKLRFELDGLIINAYEDHKIILTT